MTQEIKLNEDTARRIANVVVAVERKLKNKAGTFTLPRGTQTGFWATLTAADRETGRYSWTALVPTVPDEETDPELEESEDWGQGDKDEATGYAVEMRGSLWCLVGDTVWLTYAGSYYIFDYHPGLRVAYLESGAIFKRENNTPGSGDAVIYDVQDGSLTSGETITVYNPFAYEIESKQQDASEGVEWIEVSYDNKSGVWWVSAAECEQ